MVLFVNKNEVECLKRALLDIMANRPGPRNGYYKTTAENLYDRLEAGERRNFNGYQNQR